MGKRVGVWDLEVGFVWGEGNLWESDIRRLMQNLVTSPRLGLDMCTLGRHTKLQEA